MKNSGDFSAGRRLILLNNYREIRLVTFSLIAKLIGNQPTK